MASLKEMIYHCFNTMRGGLGNDNDPVTVRQMGRWIDQSRAAVLHLNWEKYRYDHTILSQDLGVLKPIPLPLRRYNDGATTFNLDNSKNGEVNTHNADPFYKNKWTVAIPELIGWSDHLDLRIGTAVDGELTVPIITKGAARYRSFLKFSGNKNGYCWSKGLVKIYPNEQNLEIEVPSVQDLTLASKEAISQAYIIAKKAGTQLVDKDADDNDVLIYQPFIRVQGVFARPLEVMGFQGYDPDSIVKTMDTIRYPVTESLKEEIAIHIRDNYMAAVNQFFMDRSNNALQEKDRMDSLSGSLSINAQASANGGR